MQLLPQHPSLTLRVTINATTLKLKIDAALAASDPLLAYPAPQRKTVPGLIAALGLLNRLPAMGWAI
jgi:hypothetical protein